MTTTTEKQLAETTRQFEEAGSELLAAVAAAQVACAAKETEIETMQAKLPTMEDAVQQHDQISAELKAAEKERDDELGQAMIDGRKPDTAEADGAIQSAKNRAAKISADGIASKAAARLIGEHLDRLAIELQAPQLALREALAAYLWNRVGLAGARRLEVFEAVERVNAGSYAVVPLARELMRRYVPVNLRRSDSHGFSDVLARFSDGISRQSGAIYSEGSRSRYSSAEYEALIAPLAAAGIDLSR